MEDPDLCGSRVGAKCGRWNPTAEQVKVLMDLFTAGLRTPSTDQIHNISSHLSSLGKIENKNVFYWFQNHKARERHHHHHHKKRRLPAPAPTTPLLNANILVLDPEDNKELPIPMLSAGSWNEEEKMKRGEKKTLKLFPLTSSNYHHEVMGADLRSNMMLGELHFFDTVIEPPILDLTLGF